jgi:D-3-phosphoglycerate dehydrogenase / 2-oxoglutarate reductase
MTSTFRVLISDKLDKKGIALLEEAKAHGVDLVVDAKPGLKAEEQHQLIGDYDGLIVRSATKVGGAFLQHAKKLKIVIRAGIGVDNIDISACKAQGVVVENTPRGNVVSAAEHAIALMMSLARQVPQATATTKSGVWEKSKFMGTEITGKTLGIIGTGNIGAVVADRARGLHMDVIATDPFLTEARARELGIEKVELDELLTRAHVISLHTPLLPATRNILDAEAFQKMQPGVLIINAARGGLVDEDALLTAIKEGKVRGAALDVFAVEPVAPDHPLLSCEQVVVTPHLGASTYEAQVNVAVDAAEQMIAFIKDGTVVHGF